MVMVDRIYTKDLKNYLGQEVFLAGWVNARRDHGKLIFVDLRDMKGVVQMVVLPNHAEAHQLADKIRPEWVIEIKGKVNERPEKMVNLDEENGNLEIEVLEVVVLNEAETPPFDVLSDGKEIGEEKRLQYRYLDLRRPRMNKNIKIRGKLTKFLRDELEKLDFTEVETSLLSKSSPEGARDFIVPARIEPGKFYALPQAPQQYKQLLMMAGLEKYFQVARCFRDEDTRSDRQPEFTQLDLEMSFVKQEEVMSINERLLIDLVEKYFPEKIIQEKPFPVITYKEALEKYGTDRPDLRQDKNNPNLLAFVWIVDFPFFEKDKETGKWTFTHNPFSAPQEGWLDDLMNKTNIEEILASQYDVALNGFEIGGGSIRNHKPERLKKVLEIIGYSDEQIEKDFGYFLEALKYGTPPHGGMAWGLDRLLAVLMNESSIREVIAFAKTGEGRDLMMASPAEVSVEQLKELSLEIKNKQKNK